MGKFYKTHRRWLSSKPADTRKPAAVPEAVVVAKTDEVTFAQEKVEVENPSIELSASTLMEERPVLLSIEKRETEEGIVCKISITADCDEIRYNIGSRKVTEKNRSKCKLYEGEFVLEEPSIVNASAFKDGELLCSVQG